MSNKFYTLKVNFHYWQMKKFKENNLEKLNFYICFTWISVTLESIITGCNCIR